MLLIPTIRKQHGFALLALSIWMIVLGLAVVITLALLPNRSDQRRIDNTILTIGDAQDVILSFAVKNSRLPVPDSSHNGLENTAAVSGALPYRTMGLPVAVLDQAGIPLRYTPYRNSAATVDLGVASPLYAPALPDLSGLQGSLISIAHYTVNVCTAEAKVSPVNLLDFCTALNNAIAASTPAVVTSVNTGPDHANVAYVVLSGGLENADGQALDRSLDGVNADGDVSYEDPARGRGTSYDDIVRATRFSTLQRQLSCTALVGSVDLLAAAAQGSKVVMENALAAYNDSEVLVAMYAVAILIDAISVAQNIGEIIGIGADIGKSGGGCASLVLSPVCCPALAAEVAGIVVHSVTAAVELAKVAVDIAAEVEAVTNRDLFKEKIVPGANAHLCSVIAETTAADDRGGLAPTDVP